MDSACSKNGLKRTTYRLLVGQPEGKRPLRRPRCKLVDIIKMDLGEIGWGNGVIWLCANEPVGYIKCWEVLE
jgi:hypothetical protein